MRSVAYFAAAMSVAAMAGLTSARADVVAHVSLTEQKMTVVVDGVERHAWPVSTARRGKVTPTGRYRPQSLARMHYSTLYNNAPMPYSVFFHGNYAVHGTTDVKRLGRPASAGCVRLHPEHAQALFNLVKERGFGNVSIVIESGQYALQPTASPKI
jgi:lipoprotein-anchoring transpeptidase ErfK/SrfK